MESKKMRVFEAHAPASDEVNTDDAILLKGILETSSGVEDIMLMPQTAEPSKYMNMNINSFSLFRFQYLLVHVAIMLADGLQGTHLYVLYEGYGYSVASLYALGFISGAVTAPLIGPVVDKMGRRCAATTYCLLEIFINTLELFNCLPGLIVSRVIGGITTNLLFTVFESWLVTEHRKQGFGEKKLETILRDSIIASNLSAIFSGFMAHSLAVLLGPVGPFKGAVGCTFVAFLLIVSAWKENFGTDNGKAVTVTDYMSNAFNLIVSDTMILRLGIIQGLSEGALQTFVFLWAPLLRHLASFLSDEDSSRMIGIDFKGEPKYGLIFGAFMVTGVVGGVLEPLARRFFKALVSNESFSLPPSVLVITRHETDATDILDDLDSSVASLPSTPDRSVCSCEDDRLSSLNEVSMLFGDGVQFLTGACYLSCAFLLSVPLLVNDNQQSFAICLSSFLLYECLVGVYLPCEGILRTIYMPNDSICSLMTMLRVIVNVTVAIGVFSINFISFSTAYGACALALFVAAGLQFSLIDKRDWQGLYQNLYRLSPLCQKENEPSKVLSDITVSTYSNTHTATVSHGTSTKLFCPSPSTIGLRKRK